MSKPSRFIKGPFDLPEDSVESGSNVEYDMLMDWDRSELVDELLKMQASADKLAEALDWIVDLQDPKKNDLSYEDTKYTEAEIAEKALKQYRGEDLSNKEETTD